MKSPLKNEQGAILIVELLVLAVVLTSAGFAAYEYSNHKKAANPATTPKPHVVAKPSASPSVTPIQKPANEFDVPELGFKMTVPSGLSGLKYTEKVFSGSVNGKNYTAPTATFSTTAIDQLDPQCVVVAPIGGVTEYSFDPVAASVTDISSTKQLGVGKYIVLSGPQAQCSSNATVNSMQITDWHLLQQAFSTATPL